jgi:translation initiation factor 2 beta subunit (eIF-2beta)/eIF-5
MIQNNKKTKSQLREMKIRYEKLEKYQYQYKCLSNINKLDRSLHVKNKIMFLKTKIKRVEKHLGF